VYQITDERAVEVPVTTGRKVGNSVEITGGLKEGDKIIGKVDEDIKNGSKVALSKK
jgi:multidrug efflux pump subunit AcrA (membrane-fusion protein)